MRDWAVNREMFGHQGKGRTWAIAGRWGFVNKPSFGNGTRCHYERAFSLLGL